VIGPGRAIIDGVTGHSLPSAQSERRY